MENVQLIERRKADCSVVQNDIAALAYAGMFASYYSVRLITIADSVALQFTLPIFTAILATILLKTLPGRLQVIGLIIGFAGIIAIALRSIGFLAKLMYEAIEEIDSTQVEAVTATGAGSGQVLVYGIWPQILPAFAGVSVFRWDINIRESTVLGLVGAGGIGLQLQASLNVLAWPQVTLIFIVILATVVASEWVSARVRHAFI